MRSMVEGKAGACGRCTSTTLRVVPLPAKRGGDGGAPPSFASARLRTVPLPITDGEETGGCSVFRAERLTGGQAQSGRA